MPVALGEKAIDAASFSSIRLMSGAVALALLSWLVRERDAPIVGGDWGSAAILFLYAVPFSFAYVSLSTGTGALILFGAVQCTMLAAALRSGERPRALAWAGFVTAVVGLVYLVSPGVTAPTPEGAGLMALAGVAWVAYSLRGQGVTTPVATTTGNFVRAVPFVIDLPPLNRSRSRVRISGGRRRRDAHEAIQHGNRLSVNCGSHQPSAPERHDS